MTTSAQANGKPLVSVIVPVWNVEPYLRECLDSVLRQSIGIERIELIAVNDGSTDGSGQILDEYAARQSQVRVVHQANSGGPGGPRNVGFDLARGRYVFFLDGDDYFGPEALERLVAMAERNDSDIVLGRIVGVDGRRTFRGAGVFRRNLDHADLEHVYRSGSVLKLFRRAFFERAGLRFAEQQAGGEDGDLMARAYFVARTISVVADYDCYFWRRREASQTRRKGSRIGLAERIERVERQRFEVVARYRRPGRGRDRLIQRHVRKLLRKFGRRWVKDPVGERRRAFEAGAAVLRRWHSPRLERALPAWASVRAWCLRNDQQAELEDIAAVPLAAAFGDPIAEGRQLYARFPHFRDGSGIPDRCFEFSGEISPVVTLQEAALVEGALRLSGQAYLALVGGATTVELHGWPRGRRWRFDAEAIATPDLRDTNVRYPAAGFAASVDLATAAAGRPLARGLWTVHLSIGTNAVRRSLPVRVRRARAQRAGLGRWGDVVLTASPALRLRVGEPSWWEPPLRRVAAAPKRVRGLGRRLLRATRVRRTIEQALKRVRHGLA